MTNKTYHLDGINKRTGGCFYMSYGPPLTYKQAVTWKSKITEYSWRDILIVESTESRD